MLKHLIGIGCIFVCTTLGPALSKTAKSNNDKRKSQHRGNSAKENGFQEIELLPTEFPAFSNRTSLKMLEDITAKVWRILPVIEIPKSWVITYCMKYTEISEEIERAAMRCQYDGTDWDCTFIELGGGRDDFNMGKIVSLFHDLSDRSLRLKLLRGAEICGKLWQRYKRVQDKILVRMGLNVHVKTRRKRFSKNSRKSQNLKNIRNRTKKREKDERDKKLKKAREADKKVKNIRRRLVSKITELENKQSLSPDEEKELDRLESAARTKPRMNLEAYPITEDRTELSRLQDIGSCLSRQSAKACESTVLKAVEKLI